MHDMSDNDRLAVLGEALMDELKVIREYVEDVPKIKDRLDQMDARLEVVESDLVVIKVTLKQHERLHADHSHRFDDVIARLTHLEQLA